jgi:C-terminal processing protease CtpA/Prc
LHITIKRPYSGTYKVGLVRKKVVDKAVPIYFMEHDSTGYIKVNHFLLGSASAIKYAFSELSAMGMKKLILDLRGNIGGSVEETASALSIFLPINSLVCHLRLKDSTQNYSNLTLEQPTNTSMPIVVLTDRKTISSGEIFAGCMKDQGRAIIIGDRTYGKGFVQGTHFLKNGSSLYITKARYYTPIGKFIGDKGVEPHIVAKTYDSIPPHLLAIINSSVITNYCIKQRSIAKNESSNIDKNTYNNFISFYLSTISTVKLPEESTLSQLEQYSSTKELKNEIDARKKSLTTVYKKEIEIELQKEWLRQHYQYTTAGKIEFEHSVMYDFLVKQQFIRKK